MPHSEVEDVPSPFYFQLFFELQAKKSCFPETWRPSNWGKAERLTTKCLSFHQTFFKTSAFLEKLNNVARSFPVWKNINAFDQVLSSIKGCV